QQSEPRPLPAASARNSPITQRRCHTLHDALPLDLISMAIVPRAPNCTTRRAGPGLSQAASTPHTLYTRRCCYKTAWSLLQGELKIRRPSCTTRGAVPGVSQAVSKTTAGTTRRHSHKTAWSLLQGVVPLALLSRAPNCTTRRAGPGLSQAASTPHAPVTRRRCYKTAWSLLQGEL